jgi:undecaprenyl-diphosphatase
LDPLTKLGLRLTLVVAALVLLALPFAIVLLGVLYRGPLTELDQHVATSANSWGLHSGGEVRIARYVTDLGSTLVLTGAVVVVVLYLAVWHRQRRQAIFLVVTAVLGAIIASTVKFVVGRSRPHFDHPVAHALGKSFPSGHTTNSTVIYGALLVLLLPALSRTGRLIATVGTALLVGAIAASRVLLGVHYVSDVVGGVLLGLAWLLSSTSAFATWRREGGRLPASVEQAASVEELVGPARDSRSPHT